jgi:hypothetical protein
MATSPAGKQPALRKTPTTKPAAPTKVRAGSVALKAKAAPVKKATLPAQPGRPSLYSPELAATICEHVASGKSLRVIAALEGMPHQSTVMAWLDGRQPEFSEQYARAREAQADKLAEEILTIADDGRQDTYIDGEGNERTDTEVIQRSKLRVEARKWLASKMAPKKYGDKLAVGGADDLGPVQAMNRSLTDAERAVRLSRAINDNPPAMQALLAAIAKNGAAK